MFNYIEMFLPRAKYKQLVTALAVNLYLIGHNHHGHYFHAEDISVNNYVRENNVCGIIKVRE